jgi:superfamily I DNA and RNA helicase
MAIVHTKGTKALAQQTYERLKKDFRRFAEDDKVQICDIMHLPKNFTKFELQQKLIIVVKKETNNMRRIIEALINTYPDLSQKSYLLLMTRQIMRV